MSSLRLVVDCSGSVRGGIARVLEQLENAWPQSDELILVAAPPDFTPQRARVHSVQAGGRAKTLVNASRTVNQLARKTRADGLLAISPSLTAAPAHVPVVTILHDLAYVLWPAEISQSQRRYRQVAYQANLRRSDVIRCVSHRTMHDLGGLMPWARDRAAVWPLPTPPLTPNPGRSTVVDDMNRAGLTTTVAVPGHSEHKGVELAIAALRQLPPEVGIAVITRPDIQPLWERCAFEHSVSNRVRFATGLPDGDYAALLRDCDVVAMPSHFEGLGLPVLEARSVGARVVISPDPALLEASSGVGQRMTTWTPQAFAVAVADSLTEPKPARFDDPRTWQDAATELHDDFVTLQRSN